MDDVIEQKRDVMPSAWVPKGGEKRAARDAGRVRGSQEAPAGGAKGGKKTLDEAAKGLWQLVLDTASGKLTSAERRGCHEISIWKDGVCL